MSEEFSFSDMRGSEHVVVSMVVAMALLLDADTYFGSIRIFLSVLELGSMSDALVSGGKGGFPEGVPRTVTVGAEGLTMVTWDAGVIWILLSSDLGSQSGEIAILPGREGGMLNWVEGGLTTGDGDRARADGCVDSFLQLGLLVVPE